MKGRDLLDFYWARANALCTMDPLGARAHHLSSTKVWLLEPTHLWTLPTGATWALFPICPVK